MNPQLQFPCTHRPGDTGKVLGGSACGVVGDIPWHRCPSRHLPVLVLPPLPGCTSPVWCRSAPVWTCLPFGGCRPEQLQGAGEGQQLSSVLMSQDPRTGTAGQTATMPRASQINSPRRSYSSQEEEALSEHPLVHPSGAHGAAGGHQREGRGGKGRDEQQLEHTRRCAEEIQILKEQGQQDRGHTEGVICLDVHNITNRIPHHNGLER